MINLVAAQRHKFRLID